MASRLLLIVAHGSRSPAWNHAIETFSSNLQQAVRDEPGIEEASWCYLEHAQPSIPAALEHHCRERQREIVALPLFLSVSQHVLSDIPSEVESAASLLERRDRMTVYECHGRRVYLLDPLPSIDLLADNIERRVRRLNVSMNGNGLVAVYYGAKNYLRQWNHLAFQVQSKLLERYPHSQINWSYGGEAVDFSPDPLADAIRQTAQATPLIVLIPALVAVGIVQNEVIPAAIERSGLQDRIVYPGDAILPDTELEKTVLDYVRQGIVRIDSSS